MGSSGTFRIVSPWDRPRLDLGQDRRDRRWAGDLAQEFGSGDAAGSLPLVVAETSAAGRIRREHDVDTIHSAAMVAR